MSPDNGEIKWRNKQPGLGWGMVTIAGEEGNVRAIIEALHRQQQAAASSAAGA